MYTDKSKRNVRERERGGGGGRDPTDTNWHKKTSARVEFLLHQKQFRCWHNRYEFEVITGTQATKDICMKTTSKRRWLSMRRRHTRKCEKRLDEPAQVVIKRSETKRLRILLRQGECRYHFIPMCLRSQESWLGRGHLIFGKNLEKLPSEREYWYANTVADGDLLNRSNDEAAKKDSWKLPARVVSFTTRSGSL